MKTVQALSRHEYENILFQEQGSLDDMILGLRYGRSSQIICPWQLLAGKCVRAMAESGPLPSGRGSRSWPCTSFSDKPCKC